MPIEIVVPVVGESIVDARVAKWLKKEGDAVSAGEALVELETDKVDVEVSAPQAGVLDRIAHADGADVKIGDVLGTIAPRAAEAGVAAPPNGEPAAAPSATPTAAKTAPSGAGQPPASADASVPATPSARKHAREQQVPIATVKPEGPRVTKADVERARSAPAATPASPAGEWARA